MSHVVVGTVSPVCDIDIAGFRKEGDTVYHGAEGAKFVLFMDRLEESIHIQVGIHIKQGVYMNTVKAFRRMAFGYEVAVGREAGSAVERGGGAIGGKAAVARGGTAGRRFQAREGSIECIQYFFNGVRPEFSPLLAESGRSRSIRVKAKEIEQFDPYGGSPLRNKQTDQRVRR